jgi:hypothetical protein
MTSLLDFRVPEILLGRAANGTRADGFALISEVLG